MNRISSIMYKCPSDFSTICLCDQNLRKKGSLMPSSLNQAMFASTWRSVILLTHLCFIRPASSETSMMQPSSLPSNRLIFIFGNLGANALKRWISNAFSTASGDEPPILVLIKIFKFNAQSKILYGFLNIFHQPHGR